MTNNRRKDQAYDVGESMPGTVGDSQGTVDDRLGGQSFDPEDDVVNPDENHTNSSGNHEDQKTSSSNENTREAESEESTEEESTRMKYAKRYGDSWPESRKRRFLREHDVSAREMGWKVTT